MERRWWCLVVVVGSWCGVGVVALPLQKALVGFGTGRYTNREADKGVSDGCTTTFEGWGKPSGKETMGSLCYHYFTQPNPNQRFLI